MKAIKHIIMMIALVVVMFLVITILPTCNKGRVIGLGDDYYAHPVCSFKCGCKPRWQEFSPVCKTDNMVTYLSPCHAGCSAAETINGVNVYVNCTCSTAPVVEGACSDTDCTYARDLHQTLFLVIITFSLLALLAQGVMILKSVDRRDKSVVLGLTFGMVAIIAFVCGRMMFFGIEVGSCRWYEGNRCHLFNNSFPNLIGYTSTALSLAAALVCVVTFICIRVADGQSSDECKRSRQGCSVDTEL